MKINELIEKLQKLDPEKLVITQVVGTDGSAWNMDFDFQDIQNTNFVQLRVSHPELKKMPKWNGMKYEP